MRTNIFIPKPAVRTHEGGVAARISTEGQLRRSVMANMLFEDEFYESGAAIASRIGELVRNMAATADGVVRVLDIAYEARTQMKLRHVPLLLLSELLKVNTPVTREVIADGIEAIIQRPDELGELIALFWKDGKKMLPNQMKLGLTRALVKFNEFSLAKNDSGGAGLSLKDVVFLIHPKGTDAQQALIQKVVDGKLATPDTWETSLSAGADKGATFTRLLGEKKLGALALLRNLRNMVQSGVSESLIRKAIESMDTGRVLPFRFITAARYAPQLEPQLEAKMLEGLKDMPKLLGRTALVVDHSGSMDWVISGKTELRRVDAACGLAMLLREVCEDMVLIVFGGTAGIEPARRGFAMRDVILQSKHRGATDLKNAIKVADGAGYDRLIVLTDEQSRTAPEKPLVKNAYLINVASAKNGVDYKNYIHIDGWSEACVDYIQQYETAGL